MSQIVLFRKHMGARQQIDLFPTEWQVVRHCTGIAQVMGSSPMEEKIA